MTSPIERSIPDTPVDKPEGPSPPPSIPPLPPSPLDDLKDTIIDDIGTFTRINIPGIEAPGAGPPGGTKLD